MDFDKYIERMPNFYREVLKSIHIPPEHPMYERYVGDSLWKYAYADELVAILTSYVDLEGLDMLDIGAGLGGLSAAFAKQGCLVTALDVSEGYQDVSKYGYSDCGVQVESVIGDAQNLAFPDQSFDIVCFFNVFEHVPNVNKAIREIVRVLKPGGFIVGRADFRYDKNNIKHDPHYGLPGIILLPRFLRELVVVHLTHRSNELDDIVWAKNLRDLEQRFGHEGADVYGFRDDFIVTKRQRNSRPGIGSGIIDINKQREVFVDGWHGPENWGRFHARWSSAKSTLCFLPLSRFSKVRFDAMTLEPKEVLITDGGQTQPFSTKANQWTQVMLERVDTRTPWRIFFETSPTKLVNDPRELGFAIRNVVIS